MKKPSIIAFAILVSIIINACQPSLWGTPPPPPTFVPPSATATFTPSPPAPTATSTSVPEALWINPAIPASLRETAQSWGLTLAQDKQSATIHFDLSQKDNSQINWIYALVAPFPTVTDSITRNDLRAAWSASLSGPFGGLPLLMDESTLAVFTAEWGEPAAGAVKVVPADQLLNTAWNEMPSWAIIPFESIEPKWKVLVVEDQSPIRKDFNAASYPLVGHFSLTSVSQLPKVDLPATNRDPSKLTTLALTGVTALVRATAKTMDVKGITYPGEDIRDMLREADITHINNEVPFYAGCPDPDPNQLKEVFCSAPRYIELLTDIGTDVVELSGDHFADYGTTAMYETLKIYNDNKLPYYGGGENVEDGRKPLLMEVNGNKLMFIACNIKSIYATATETKPGAVPCDFDYMTEQIKLYRAQGYLPIATFQYHEFDSAVVRPQQQIDFRLMADAGAVVVSGSQAHVAQVMEFYNGAFIHYGLGNLFFDQMKAVGGSKVRRREFIDRHAFYDGQYLGVELITTYLEDFSRPRYMNPDERASFLTNYFEESGWTPAP
ncbi:MAG: CapA family protein [Chloroflexi bacterium]|nr:CapA family protein [Chloroflexota bacterium]